MADRRSSLSHRLMQILYFGASAGVGIAIFWVVPGTDQQDFLPLLLLAAFLDVVLHETGHAIAAISNRFRIRGFGVWPLALNRANSGWRARWMGKTMCLGFVAAEPDDGANLRQRMIRYVAGGPIASVLTAAAAGALYLIPFASWIKLELALISYLAAASFLLGLIPFRSSQLASDAARLKMLWWDKPAADRFCALMLVMRASRNGVRPRDLNPAQIAAFPGPNDGSADWLTAELFLGNYLMDTGKIEMACTVFLRVFEGDMHPQARNALQLHAVWVEAKYRRDLVAAQSWMQRTSILDRKDDAYLNSLARARAGIAFLMNRLDDAEAEALASLKYCDQLEERGSAILIREKTEELLTEIAAVRQQSAASPEVAIPDSV